MLIILFICTVVLFFLFELILYGIHFRAGKHIVWAFFFLEQTWSNHISSIHIMCADLQALHWFMDKLHIVDLSVCSIMLSKSICLYFVLLIWCPNGFWFTFSAITLVIWFRNHESDSLTPHSFSYSSYSLRLMWSWCSKKLHPNSFANVLWRYRSFISQLFMVLKRLLLDFLNLMVKLWSFFSYYVKFNWKVPLLNAVIQSIGLKFILIHFWTVGHCLPN